MKKITPHFFIISFLLFSCSLFAQSNEQAKIDSLEAFIKSTPADTSKIMASLELADIYRHTDLDKAISYVKKASKSAEEIHFIKGIGRSDHLSGLLDNAKGNYKDAKLHFTEAIKIYEELNDQTSTAKVIYNLGVTCVYLGDYSIANDYFFKSLRLYEATGNQKGIGDAYSAIANVYGRKGNSAKELEFHTKCLKIKVEMKDNYGIAAAYINIGNAYGRQQKWDTALTYYFKGLHLGEEMHNQKWILSAVGNIGTVYTNQGKYKEAQEYLFKCYDLCEKVGDKQAMANTLNSIGINYNMMKDYANAIKYLNQALKMATEIGNKPGMETSFEDLALNYAQLGDYKNAYEYHKQFSNLKDSMLNEESNKQIAEVAAKYDSEKQEQQITLLNKDKEIQAVNLKRQKLIIWFGGGGLFIVLLLAFFIFREYKQKKKANVALNVAYHEIEEKNKDITDSINYAKRIQTAMLPSMDTIHTHLPDSFVLFQPKDIVSGDFYWFTEKNNKLIIAVADCTGHGVPGAFMSMIGNDMLTQIVIEKGILQPNLILTQLDDGVKNALKQDTEKSETKDGMDIAIISINKNSSEVEYAGALRPLWLISGNNSEITEIKADKHSIGGAFSVEQKMFTNHTINLQKGDRVYMSTDGYADQFGGELGKKFMTKNMKDLVVSIQSKNMNEQGAELKNTLAKWKSDRQQVDDVLVVGIKI